jgi:hypothetical protein
VKATQRTPIIGLVAAGVLAFSGAALAQEQIDDSRTVSPTVMVEIDEIIVGHIRVIGVAGNEMTVTGTIGADVDEFVIEGGPNAVEIYAEIGSWDDDDDDGEGGRRRWRGRQENHDVEVNLEIRVPTGASLEIEGVTASFEVEGVDGSIEIESVTGDITYSGSATVLDLANVTGSITASATNVIEADFESVNGNMSFTGNVSAGGELSMENVNGSIDLTVPADISASFDVETMMGNIDNEFGQEPRRESRWIPSQELSFTNGGGSAEIMIETLQGSVTIRKQ